MRNDIFLSYGFSNNCFLNLFRSFNWPEVPNLREEEINEQYFEVFLVLFITCKDSIEQSFQWERQ
jgi:hypothetical protein